MLWLGGAPRTEVYGRKKEERLRHRASPIIPLCVILCLRCPIIQYVSVRTTELPCAIHCQNGGEPIGRQRHH